MGYAVVKKQPGICYWMSYPEQAIDMGMMSTYKVLDARGYYINAEVTYKYRSLIEATAAIKYAPHDKELFDSDKHYNNYKMGVDRASTVGNFDIKINPWRPLSLNVGLDRFVNMDDVVNLHAGANYRLNSNISLWLQAHNLLNRRYDILYGMGAQRIGFMLGGSLTF